MRLGGHPSRPPYLLPNSPKTSSTTSGTKTQDRGLTELGLRFSVTDDDALAVCQTSRLGSVTIVDEGLRCADDGACVLLLDVENR